MPTFANINTGTTPNDGTGDSLRQSFRTTNNNFSILNSIVTDSGNITANITSTGFSSFNTANITTLNTSTIGGELTTATQANITQVGTLSNLTVSGTTELQGTFNANGPVTAYNTVTIENRFTLLHQLLANVVEITGSHTVQDYEYFLLANTDSNTNCIVTLPNASISTNRFLQVRYFDPSGINANTTTVTVQVETGAGNIFTSGSQNFNSFDIINEGADTAELVSNGTYWFRLTKT